MAVTRKYHIGDLVQGTITKLTKFGAFARLVENPEIEGLIHISELAPQRVGHPKEVVREQDVLTLRVVKIDPENRRLGLSIKKVASPDYAEADYKRATDPTFDYVDFEAATLKEEERRRAERKKGGGKKGKKGGKGEFGFEEFDDDYR
jgi:small subunit ribosomal protein S1